MKRRYRPFFAWFAAFALVITQLATAAYTCPQLASAAAAEAAPVQNAMPHCDDEGAPNLCERHCEYGKASVDTPKPVAAPDMAVAFVRTVAIPLAHDRLHAETIACIPAGPPVTRFTVLRI